MSAWRLLPICGLIVAALILLERRARAPSGRQRGVRLATAGGDSALLGLAFVGFAAVVTPSGDTPPYQLWLSLLAGGVAGAAWGWLRTGKYAAQLRRDGRLTARRDWAARMRGLPEWLIWACIFVVIGAYQFPPLRELAHSRSAGIPLAALGGLLVGSGVTLWLWARRKEREGLSPLVVPFNHE